VIPLDDLRDSDKTVQTCIVHVPVVVALTFASRYRPTVCHEIIPLQVVEMGISKFFSDVSLLLCDVNV